MDANQLRLGNYVMLNLDPDHYLHHKLNGKIGIVNSIIDNGERPFSIRIKYIENETQEYNAHQVSVNIISPIPLTEELLEKCGFEKICDGTFHLKDLYIELHSKTPFIMIGGIGATDFECLYLHHLQNIWHSLYNEDLTINF